MNINKEFAKMVSNYEDMAAKITARFAPSAPEPETEPVKFYWAKQEGLEPHYEPNTDSVIWTPGPKPAYDVPELLKMSGSMSPETMAETYPMFGLKSERLDPLLIEIYQQVLEGGISQQRGAELAFQLMKDTYKQADALGKPKGAGAKSSSSQQTAANAVKGQKIVGDK